MGATENATGAVPPEAVTGVNATTAVLIVRARAATACVATRSGLTVRLSVLLAWAPFASVIVTVYVVVVEAVLGVPEIKPVVGARLSAAGSAGEIAYANGAVPPVTVTGVNATAAVWAVRAFVATAWVAPIAGLIVKLKV